MALVQAILNGCRQLKSRMKDANHSRDPTNFVIPDCLCQTEDEISRVCSRKQLSIFDVNPPSQIGWEQVLVRCTIDRRTGVIISEENVHALPEEQPARGMKASVPKEILSVIFFGDGDRAAPLIHATQTHEHHLRFV